MEKEDEIAVNNSNSHNAAIRCAKAALLLSSLRTRRHHQEKEIMEQTIDDLKMEIVQERLKRKKLKLCNLFEFAVQIILLMLLFTFILMIAFK